MDELRSLSARQLDALREVANIGAGHAATALSLMTGQTIMISVPRLVVSAVNEIPNHVREREEPVAAVLLRMLGDLTGLTLLVLPRATALRVAEMMARKPEGTFTEMGEYQQSAIREAGNILSSAYLNALAEFMGMILLPSPPQLEVDLSDAIFTSTYLESAKGTDLVFVVESEFFLKEMNVQLRGFFFLLPDAASLAQILKAIRLG
jgi:chemotaxis protein CheC